MEPDSCGSDVQEQYNRGTQGRHKFHKRIVSPLLRASHKEFVVLHEFHRYIFQLTAQQGEQLDDEMLVLLIYVGDQRIRDKENLHM